MGFRFSWSDSSELAESTVELEEGEEALAIEGEGAFEENSPKENPAAEDVAAEEGALSIDEGGAEEPIEAPVEQAALLDVPASSSSVEREHYNRMDLLDDEHFLQSGERLLYSVIEEREDPEVLVVDEQGALEVPLIGRMVFSTNATCRAIAYAIKQRLQEDFFYQATVVLRRQDLLKGQAHVYVYGEVVAPGLY